MWVVERYRDNLDGRHVLPPTPGAEAVWEPSRFDPTQGLDTSVEAPRSVGFGAWM